MQQTSVVTGAGGGLGQAICKSLVAAGHRVFGLDIDGAGMDALARDLGEWFSTIEVDLSDAAQVRDAFARIGAQVGALHALVNNAGTCFMSDFPDIPADELDRQMAVNFSSAFHCCQQAIPLMQKAPGVRKIVNISSNGAYNFDVFDPPHYRASKAAMDTLTKDLARRYA
ncbi:MAG: SDR family NAD(P)-dependent oxidoreductase, partial [Arenibacterium sp.]